MKLNSEEGRIDHAAGATSPLWDLLVLHLSLSVSRTVCYTLSFSSVTLFPRMHLAVFDL